MSWDDISALFLHFLSLSVFATGGALALATDMHRYVVEQNAYITHDQFLNAIALAQAAPGPNILFVTVLGWQIASLPGALATTIGLSMPAIVFPFIVSRLGRTDRFDRALKAMQRGLGPIAIGLMAATGWLLARQAPGGWKGDTIIVAVVVLLLATRLPPVLFILGAGVLGAVISW